jgi:hypothetical protein
MRLQRAVRHQLPGTVRRQVPIQTALLVDVGELVLFGLRLCRQLVALPREIRLLGVGLRADRHVFAGGHRQRAGDETRDSGDQHVLPRGIGGRDADDEARRRDDAIVGAEHRGTKPPDSFAAVTLTMPRVSLLVVCVPTWHTYRARAGSSERQTPLRSSTYQHMWSGPGFASHH